jgi:hypothetical protein
MTMNAIQIDRAQGDVSADELCARLRIGRDALVSSLRELELAGFIVNLTPHLPPLKSSWLITVPIVRRRVANEGLRAARSDRANPDASGGAPRQL